MAKVTINGIPVDIETVELPENLQKMIAEIIDNNNK